MRRKIFENNSVINQTKRPQMNFGLLGDLTCLNEIRVQLTRLACILLCIELTMSYIKTTYTYYSDTLCAALHICLHISHLRCSNAMLIIGFLWLSRPTVLK